MLPRADCRPEAARLACDAVEFMNDAHGAYLTGDAQAADPAGLVAQAIFGCGHALVLPV